MEKPEKIIPSLCINYQLSENKKSYTCRDVILYAIGVGASQDPNDLLDLKYTYENHEDFSVIPSFSTVITDLFENFMTFTKCPGFPEFNPMMLLHGEHKIIIYKPLPTEAKVYQKCKIKSVEDKRKGALVILLTETFDEFDGSLLCINEASLFIRGLGGFDSKHSLEKPGDTQIVDQNIKTITNLKTPPDFVYIKTTALNEAIIYRLSGDLNPLHIDPEMAKLGGFEAPILHGLCTFGIATHGIVKLACNNQPNAIYSISARFTSPVIPGDTLKTEIWKFQNGLENSPFLKFKTTNMSTNKICIENGIAILSSSYSQNSKI
uniref:Hydroxysteroid 17-beta dehydrogenase 4 n=1 Tax=Nephromyces sp. MMRI TaxID=2496275 RepID=A0A3S8V2Y4_9APIC|nr:hydroxysteroid 17-beta dehydrogenase 4 [Nephromyces sp. MMRI]